MRKQMKKPILDFIPALGRGPEPSLRSLVFQYYAANFDDAEASIYARDYCEQIEYQEQNKS